MPKDGAPAHRPALDGLRFVAFLLVFLHHALGALPIAPYVPFIRFGSFGVRIFFVLSGFLIGNILLETRERAGRSSAGRLGSFYGRRALRIFPVYYVVLVVALLAYQRLGLRIPSDVWPWHFLYLTNVKIFLGRSWVGPGSHFWSLSVEEHFYLIAPFLMMVAPRRWIGPVCVGTWVAIAALRGYFFHANTPWGYWALSPMHFDALGLGLATALVERDGVLFGISRRQFLRWGAACGIGAGILFAVFYVPLPGLVAEGLAALVAAVVLFFWRGGSEAPGLRVRILRLVPILLLECVLLAVYMETRRTEPVGLCTILLEALVSAGAASLVLFLWRGGGGMLRSVLGFGPIAYLGTISYCLYLVHPFVLDAFANAGVQTLPAALWSFGASIGIATVSWFALEKPIGSLKRFLA